MRIFFLKELFTFTNFAHRDVLLSLFTLSVKDVFATLLNLSLTAPFVYPRHRHPDKFCSCVMEAVTPGSQV